MLRSWGLLLLASLATAGCAGSSTQVPATTEILKELPRVSNSRAAPCRLQREVAAQNSYLATVEAGKVIVYQAPCDVDPKPKAPPAAKPAPVAEVDAERARLVASR